MCEHHPRYTATSSMHVVPACTAQQTAQGCSVALDTSQIPRPQDHHCADKPVTTALLRQLPQQGLAPTSPASPTAVIGDDAGLKSIYWWDGKVQKDEELLLVMKTQTVLLQQLVEAVKKHHPYDEPEVISLPITGGSSTYIKWIHDSTGGS